MADDPTRDITDADLEGILRSLTVEDRTLDTPPADLWSSIEAAADADGLTVVPDAPATPDSAGGNVVPLFRRTPFLAAAAAVVLIVGVLGAVLATDGGSDEEVVASVDLSNDGLPVSFGGTATASFVEVDGRVELAIEVSEALPDDGQIIEVWAIDTDVVGMHSLGTIDGDARLLWPENLDPADFPVIDISLEPVDGDPTHSGQSLLRGVVDL